MVKEITAVGKDILEAKENARAALGAGELEDVQFEIIDAGTKGFFGFMSRPAKVRAFIELPDSAPQRRPERPKRERREDNKRDNNHAKQKQKNKPERKKPEQHEKEAPKSEVIPEEELKMERRFVEAGEDMSYDFVKTLLSDIGLNAEAELYACEDGTRRITIVGDDASTLIGHHGDTLDALQYLTNLASARKNSKGERDKSRVTLDIEGYRKKREETLRALARRMAAKALRNKRSVMLEPMSAYERRIIHSEIQGIEGVSTNSIGSDNNRKIVIFLTDKKPKELFEEDEKANEFKKEFESDDEVTNNVLETLEVSASANPDGEYDAEDTESVETIRPADEIVDEDIDQ
ncbi:MAG: Jag N-terminal domain-containing protein [Clostridia bacterium]|nr:Jag N-terminal domain-containing protein [Clostridia bacterium]